MGAGFYVDATQAPWSQGYRMYSYVAKELPRLVEASFPVDPARTGIFGHSMGGHGALTIALKNPDTYKSVSAFAPICSPMRCPWGEKALTGYLGADRALWRDYDASALLKEACRRAGVSLDLRLQEDYDHSYFFIATFIEDHLRFHARNAPEALAVCVAMKSIRGGDRQS